MRFWHSHNKCLLESIEGLLGMQLLEVLQCAKHQWANHDAVAYLEHGLGNKPLQLFLLSFPCSWKGNVKKPRVNNDQRN